MASTIINGTLQENSRTLAPTSVGSQVLLMSVVSVVTILLFNILRPKNKIIYEPKVKYHEGAKPPPRISDSLFGWLPPLIHTKEPELLDKIGLDAVAFLRFLRLLRWLFTAITILTCGILLPINVVYNLRNVKSTKRDILSMLTIRDVSGTFLYAHIVVTYLITFLIIGFVDVHWKAIIHLRHTWFRSPEYLQSFYARTLQVRRVPKKLQSDEGLTAIFQSVKVPYPTTSVHIGRKVGKLPELIEYHNQTVREFEEILVKYLKGGKIKAKRPTIRTGATCGIGGVKRDAIDFYTAKLQRTEAAIEEYRNQIDTRKAENYGFASMAAVPYAHVVAQMIAGKHPKGTQITLAPNPKDIIWNNMNKTDVELARNRTIGFAWLVAVCFFNTVPLLIISVLANLDSMRAYVSFLEQWFESSPLSFAFISGVLPPAISGLFGFFLPIIMRWLTKFMGALTHSKLDRAVVARYFSFLIISQLIIFTLLGVIFQSVTQIIKQIGKSSFKEIIDNLHELPATIHSTYINQSSYWLTFFPLRGFLAIFDLAQIINLVWLSFKTHVFGRTPRDIREWTQPPEFQYALFMGAVGFVFAPLAPLVPLAAAIVFWMNSWVYKYQLMFVYVSKVESGGFRYFTPTQEEINLAKVYSERADAKGNKLQKRFGHPALHAELFTPMLHKNMMPLLSEVYQGKIGNDSAKLGEYGGQTMEAQIVAGGIKIAAIDQRDLEYDPALYQRDRGELDWDQRSIATTAAFESSSNLHVANSQYYPHPAQAINGYDKYLAMGPGSTSTHEIELAPMDSMEEPLLSPGSLASHKQGFVSQQSFMSLPPSAAQSQATLREAPLHRPQDRAYSPSPAYMSTDNLAHGVSPISPYPNTAGSDTSHQSYFSSQRQSSGNILSGQQIRTPSPGPNVAMQYPPQQLQHGRQSSATVLAGQQPRNGSPTQYQRSQSPGPNQAYPPQQHTRQSSGNMLAGRAASPGPYQAYNQQQQQQHARQISGNVLANGRSTSPGPSQAYSAQLQQHARQTSGNMLADTRSRSPGPYQSYTPTQQPHSRQMSGNPLGDYQRAPSTSPQQGYSQPPPGLQGSAHAQYQQQQQQSGQTPNNNNMAGRGAHRTHQ
uniref:DUF221-domain-containing protein n=1 Tax=Psilocybe cubensis TaxID=181762 RepID=A0A8H7Y363_PSICU